MTRAFAAATAVTPTGDGGFDVSLDEQWTIGGRMHGGYLVAVLARAAAAVCGAQHPHPTAVGASFIAPPVPGAATVGVELLRVGRSASQLRAQLVQDGRLCVEAILTQGLLTGEDPWWTALPPADVPAEEDCVALVRNAPGSPFDVALMDVVDLRVDPDRLQWAFGRPTHRGVISGWQRLADGTAWDPASLLVALDAPPPVSFDLDAPGWAPTLQFSAYLRRLPAPGPIRFRMHANDVGGERMDETAYAWDSAGRLVGQATQLAGIRRPRGLDPAASSGRPGTEEGHR